MLHLKLKMYPHQKKEKKLTKVSNYKISQFHCIIGAVERQEREWQNGNLLGLHI